MKPIPFLIFVGTRKCVAVFTTSRDEAVKISKEMFNFEVAIY